jgi:hypothetical protein
MANYNFEKDLIPAKESEKEVADLLEKIYNAKILNFEDTNKYDILAQIKDRQFTVEVKDDYIAERTGNIAIEYSSRGKPSGISVTQSDYYIYKINREIEKSYIYIIKVSKIKEMISNNLYFKIINGGDRGSNTLFYLFKEKLFCDSSKKHFI